MKLWTPSSASIFHAVIHVHIFHSPFLVALIKYHYNSEEKTQVGASYAQIP